MTIDEFRERFGYTTRRADLTDQLEQELRKIAASGHEFTAAVFGSMVNGDKAEPGDVDLLLCVSQAFATRPWPFRHDDIHIKGTRLMANFDPVDGQGPIKACFDLPTLILNFNASTKNVGEDIVLREGNCVEVTL